MTVPFSKAMQGYGNDFIKEMFAAARNPDMISFAGGAPAPEVYPLDAFRAASDKAFEEWGRTMMAYDGAEGVLPLREIIAGERMASMGVECTAADIRVLSGSQNGIDFIARTYLDEGDTIICEYPCIILYSIIVSALACIEINYCVNINCPVYSSNGCRCYSVLG